MAIPDYARLYLALCKRQVPLKRESVYVLFSLKNFFYRYKIRIFALYFKDMRIISGSHRGKQQHVYGEKRAQLHRKEQQLRVRLQRRGAKDDAQ